MWAIKEVKVISDDSNSKECLRQLHQVIFILSTNSICQQIFKLYIFRTNTTSYGQEIVLLSQLSHPNIVQYYGSDLVNIELMMIL